MRILVADHDPTMVEDTARALSDDFVVDVATSKLSCLAMLDVSEYHLVVAAERLDDGSGLELLSQAGKRWPEVLRVLAIEPDRVHLLAGRLKPFKLFETISYPIDPDKLRNILLLAQAAEDVHVDTLNVQHIVLEDEVDGAAQQPVAAASGAPPPQARAPQTNRAAQPNRAPPSSSAPTQRASSAAPTARRAASPASQGAQPPTARGAAPTPARQAASTPARGAGGAIPGGARGVATGSGLATRTAGASRSAPTAPASRSTPTGAGQRPAAVNPSGRAKLSAAVGFESPATTAPAMPGALSRRLGERRAGSERRGTISVSAEPETFAGAESLAEAAEIAASLRPRLDAPDVFGKRRTMMFVAAGLGLAVVAVAAAMMFSGDDAPPAAATSAPIANPTLQPADPPEPVAQEEPQPLALASIPADAPAADTFKSSDPPEVAAFVADIESALTVDDFARARGLLDTLREIAPQHPRLSFFTALIARGEEMRAIEGGEDLPEPPTLGPAIRTATRKPAVPASSVQGEGSRAAAGNGSRAGDRPTTAGTDRDVERKRAASLRALAPAAPDRGAVERQRTDSLRALTPAAPDAEAERRRAASLRALAPKAPAASGSADPRRSPASAAPATTASADTRLRPAATTPPVASLAPNRTSTPPPPAAPASTFSGRTLEENGRSTAPPSGSAQPRTIVLPVVKEARLVRQVDPEYPRTAQREGVEGSIDLRFTVKADGKVADIEVVEATPANTFDREAIAAVRRWRYDPRREDGVAVDSRTRVRLEFKLDADNRRR
jgi:periplasmic protein TonB